MVPRPLREYPCKFAVRMAQLIPAFRAYNADLVPEVWGLKVKSLSFGFWPFSTEVKHQTRIVICVFCLWFQRCSPEDANPKVPLHELFAQMPVNEWHEAELHHVVAYLRKSKHVKIPPEFLPLIPPNGIFWKDPFNFLISISHSTYSGRVEDPTVSLCRSVSSLGVGSNQIIHQVEDQFEFIVGTWWVIIAKPVLFSCLQVWSNHWTGKFKTFGEIHGNNQKNKKWAEFRAEFCGQRRK